MPEPIKNIPYTTSRSYRNSYDLYLPENTSGAVPLLVYFYGGSLKKGSKDRQRFPAAAAKAGIAVAVPDYRLIPDVSYPAFINDAAEAVAVISGNIGNYISVNSIFVGGHSAGAYLSMMLCFDKSYLAAFGIDSDTVSGYLFISGQPTKHFSVLESEGLDGRRIIVDETAALWHIREHGAPLFIATSDCDLPNRREQNYLLRGTLARFGYDADVTFVDLTGCKHGDFTKPEAGENGIPPILPHVIGFISDVTAHNGKN